MYFITKAELLSSPQCIMADGIYSRVGAADLILGGFPGNYNDNNVNPSDHFPLYMDIVTYNFKVLDGITSLTDWPEEVLFNEAL